MPSSIARLFSSSEKTNGIGVGIKKKRSSPC
jgi:hypothetical protein